MKKFFTLTGIAVPLMRNNIDTDQIIPSREMKKVSKLGLAEGLFSGQKYLYEKNKKVSLNPDFILNQNPYEQATILISGENFGCGSSREHAVWALKDYGFKAIIAVSFGKIFYNNCMRNGLLPISLLPHQIERIVSETSTDPASKQLTLDLKNLNVISPSGAILPFELEEYYQEILLNGWDFIDVTMQYLDQIDNFIEDNRKNRNWAQL